MLLDCVVRTEKVSNSMLHPSRRPFFILTCVLFAVLSATAQKTTTKYDEHYDFSQHKRYQWRENRLVTRQNPDTNQVMDLKIVKAVNQLLAAKGFVKVQDNPDFYIYYDGGGNVKLAAGSGTQGGSGRVTTAEIAPDYGLGEGPNLTPATWLKVNGQIEFHLMDAVSQKSLWDTTYSKTFRDPNKALRDLDQEVNELVTRSFRNFPPPAKR